MADDNTRRGRRVAALVWGALAAAALAFCLRGVPENPPGFFVDEASIAYNAHLIARRCADEHSARWPLFFEAFGEYKSPLFIYLLAGLYKLTGPSIAVARALSAVLGAAAALLLGWVAARSVKAGVVGDESRERDVRDEIKVEGSPRGGWLARGWAAHAVGVAVAVSALLTPWLFEISRMVFEVALLPLALSLFLLALLKAHRDGRWSWADAARVAAALALVTYSYSVGRLLAPLLAFGLILFGGGGRFGRAVVRPWLLYALTLLPLFAFTLQHPGALGSRFHFVTFITPQMSWAEVFGRFADNYAGSFDLWNWLVTGDPEPRHHVQTMGSVLAATFALAVAGLARVLGSKRLRRDAWWRFVVWGLLVSPLPASLTIDHFHTLRLAALPVFLLLLNVPALAWLLEAGGRARVRRAAFAVLLACMLWQGFVFRRQFAEAAPRRWHNFDTFYTQVFEAAISRPERPVHLIDNHGAPGYMHAYWYAALRGMDTKEFVRLPKEQRPPPGALVISTELPCTDCQMILERASFRAYIQK